MAFGAIGLLGKGEITFFAAPNIIWLLWVAVFFLVGFSEELFFRGFVMGVIRREHGRVYAIVASSIIFGLIHSINPSVSVLAIVNIVAVGVFLALIYDYTKSLWLTIGFHFVWDAFQGTILGLPVSGLDIPSIFKSSIQGNELITGGAFGFESSICVTAIFLIAIVITLLIGEHYRRARIKIPVDSQGVEA